MSPNTNPNPNTNSTPICFSGSPIDRAERERRDPAWIAAQAASEDSRFLPMTGYSLEQCRKHRLTVNSALIARR